MTFDELYESILDKAINNKVDLSDFAYDIVKVWSQCSMDKCIKHLKDDRCCICKKCLLDIQKNGKCDGNVFLKRSDNEVFYKMYPTKNNNASDDSCI